MVAELVDGVSKLDQIQFKNRQEAQAESFRKMLLAMVRDIRVIMVKLADRMHNMRTLGAMPPVKRRRIARETLEIYAPIAERLGLYAVKLELEDLGFRALYPLPLQGARARAEARARQSEGVHRRRSPTPSRARSRRRRSTAASMAREKHLYSIYQKMQQQAHLAQRDGRRLRLSHHRRQRRHLLPRARPGPQRLQAHARALQGLHRDPARQRLPVAAHDAVRPERRTHRGADPLRATCTASPSRASRRTGNTSPAATRSAASQHDRAREWLASLVQIQEGGSSEEFLESVKVDLFPDKVYVFTPEGQDPAPADAAPRPWISPTRSIPTSATAASRPRSTGAWCRCARRCATGRRWRSSPPRARPPTPPGRLPGHRQGARRDPPLPEESQARRGARNRRQRLLGLALEEFSLALEDVIAEVAARRVGELNLKDADELTRRSAWGSAWLRWWHGACSPGRPAGPRGAASAR